MVKRGIDWKILGFSFLAVIIVSSFGSLFMINLNDGWYDSVRPKITPPDYLFGVVWTILYILIALSLYFAWVNSRGKLRSKVGWSYGANLVLNAIWTPLFFGMHNPLLGFIDIILIWITIIWMLIVSWKIDRKAFYLLLPYLLWISFASVLNGLISFG